MNHKLLHNCWQWQESVWEYVALIFRIMCEWASYLTIKAKWMQTLYRYVQLNHHVIMYDVFVTICVTWRCASKLDVQVWLLFEFVCLCVCMVCVRVITMYFTSSLEFKYAMPSQSASKWIECNFRNICHSQNHCVEQVKLQSTKNLR